MAPLPRVGSNLALVALMGAFVTASDFAAGGPEPSARLLFPDEPVAEMDEEGRERTLFVIRGMVTDGFTFALANHQRRRAQQVDQLHLHLEQGRLMEKPVRARGRDADPLRKDARSA